MDSIFFVTNDLFSSSTPIFSDQTLKCAIATPIFSITTPKVDIGTPIFSNCTHSPVRFIPPAAHTSIDQVSRRVNQVSRGIDSSHIPSTLTRSPQRAARPLPSKGQRPVRIPARPNGLGIHPKPAIRADGPTHLPTLPYDSRFAMLSATHHPHTRCSPPSHHHEPPLAAIPVVS